MDGCIYLGVPVEEWFLCLLSWSFYDRLMLGFLFLFYSEG